MVRYPIDDNTLLETIKKSGSSYPVSNKLFWHNGVHIGINCTMPIYCVHDGTIVAMRVEKEYKKIDIGDTFSEAELQYHTKDAWGSLSKELATYFDVSGEGGSKSYKIKASLPEGKKVELLRNLRTLFSSSFMLVYHKTKSMHNTDIEFYSLYLHMKPAKYLSFGQLVKLTWFRVTAKPAGVSYYGIQTYTDEKRTSPGVVIPGETIIIPNGKKTSWTLNNVTGSGYVDEKAYRKVGEHYETKRPTDLEKDDGKRFYASGNFKKTAGIVLYSSDEEGTRNAIGMIGGNESVVLVDPDEFLNKNKTLRVRQMDGTNIKQEGYIYLDFPFSVVSACQKDSKYDHDKENKTIDDYAQKDDITAKCTAYGVEFSCPLRSGLSFDSVCTPDDGYIQCGDILGYPGLFAGNKEQCHFEVFAPDVKFMETDKKEEFPSEYIVKTPCTKYTDRPRTSETKAKLPWGFSSISSGHILKLKNDGTSAQHVSGDRYYEIECVAKKVHQNMWIASMDLPKSIGSGWYYDKNGVERSVTIYESNKSLDKSHTVTLYPNLGYHVVDQKDIVLPAKGKEKKIPLKLCKVESFYEKVGNLPTLLIARTVLQEKLSGRNGIVDVFDVKKEIPPAELLSDIGLNPPPPQGSLGVGTVLESDEYAFDVFSARNAKEPSATWMEAYEKNTETNKIWLNSDFIYLRKSGKQKNIEQIPYNDWLYFFEKRDSVSSEAKMQTFDGLVKNNDEVLKKLNEAAKTRTDTFGSFVNADTDCSDYMSSLVYKRKTEWLKDDALSKAIHEDDPVKKARIEKIRNETCFWDEAKSVASGKKGVVYPSSDTNWYFHPILFLDHLGKVELDEINPYKHKKIPKFWKEKTTEIGAHLEEVKELIVESNPGFAPLTSSPTGYQYNGESFAICTSPFNVLRQMRNSKVRHTGVDLAPAGDTRATRMTPIKSFITGDVWATTWSNSTGNTLIIKGITGKKDKLYLLGHLDSFKVKPGERVYPGTIVGITGGSAANGTGKNFYETYPVHLHLEVRICSEIEKDNVLDETKNNTPGFHQVGEKTLGEELAWTNAGSKLIRRNPFNHAEKYRG